MNYYMDSGIFIFLLLSTVAAIFKWEYYGPYGAVFRRFYNVL